MCADVLRLGGNLCMCFHCSNHHKHYQLYLCGSLSLSSSGLVWLRLQKFCSLVIGMSRHYKTASLSCVSAKLIYSGGKSVIGMAKESGRQIQASFLSASFSLSPFYMFSLCLFVRLFVCLSTSRDSIFHRITTTS